MKKVILVLMVLAVSLFAKIDINKATAEELASIKGIGQKKAAAIVKYRKAHGMIKSIDELKNIKGIDEKIISNLKNDVKKGKAKKQAKKGKMKAEKKAKMAKKQVKKQTKKAKKDSKKSDKK